ncbi:MAG: 3-phosphoshikimate 1-carboxyvinyltransferase [Promethearchaeota archaeon]
MDLKIKPTNKLNGEITAPSSKSYSHRALVAAGLTEGVSVIKNPLNSGDVKVTIEILKALNIRVLEETGGSYIIEKSIESFKPVYKTINCKNSGTSLRIFSALSLLIKGGLTFTGEFLKRERPIIPLLNALKKLGAEYTLRKNKLKIERFRKSCDKVKISGDISSQFITALLFLCPKIKCNNLNLIELEITSPIISYPYIQITLDVLRSFGVNIIEKLDENKKGKFIIECNQNFRTQVYTVPGDFSSAAFLISAAALSKEDSNIKVRNLDLSNPQGDKKIIELLTKMGAKIDYNWEKKVVEISGNINRYPLNGIEIDCVEIPDLFPILAVIGAFAKGKTVLYNAENLRRKESDRLMVMARELKRIGVNVEEFDDKLIIYGIDELKKEFEKVIEFNHENDHRIAMACTIAGLNLESESVIKQIEITEDSYPGFVKDLLTLGAKIQKVENKI